MTGTWPCLKCGSYSCLGTCDWKCSQCGNSVMTCICTKSWTTYLPAPTPLPLSDADVKRIAEAVAKILKPEEAVLREQLEKKTAELAELKRKLAELIK